MTRQTRTAFASGAALSAAAIWGFAFVVVKDSLTQVGPLWMMAVRFSIAAAALALLFVHKLRKITAVHVVRGAVLGALLFTAYVFQTVGCVYTTAGKNAFLTAAYVVLVPLLGWGLGGEKPYYGVFIAAVVALAGIALLSLGGADNGAVNRGDVLTIICAIFFAFHIIYMERSSKGGSVDDVMINSVLQFAVAAVLSAIAAPIFDGGFPLAALRTGRVFMSMLYLGVLSTMVGFVFQNIALKYVNPAIATILLSFESAFAALFSAVCLGERFTGRMALGCVMIFGAVLLAQAKLPSRQKLSGRKR